MIKVFPSTHCSIILQFPCLKYSPIQLYDLSIYIFLQDHQSIGQSQGISAQVKEFGGQRSMAAYYGTVVFLATLDCV